LAAQNAKRDYVQQNVGQTTTTDFSHSEHRTLVIGNNHHIFAFEWLF